MAFAGVEDTYENTADWQKIMTMEKGMDAARTKLRDPFMAKFRHVFFHQGRDGISAACGEVSSVNNFANNTEFQRFISAGSQDLTFFEKDLREFPLIWGSLCESLPRPASEVRPR